MQLFPQDEHDFAFIALDVGSSDSDDGNYLPQPQLNSSNQTNL